MIPLLVLVVLAAGPSGHELDAGRLPVCSNRLVGSVVRRTGCTVGDGRCWIRSGGFCTHHVERRLGASGPLDGMRLERVGPEDVRAGDIAVFSSRAHYAYVEAVVKDERGRPIAVDVSEYNFGTCWVDKEFMVTDRYKLLHRRAGIALRDVDGGFLRARRGAR